MTALLSIFCSKYSTDRTVYSRTPLRGWRRDLVNSKFTLEKYEKMAHLKKFSQQNWKVGDDRFLAQMNANEFLQKFNGLHFQFFFYFVIYDGYKLTFPKKFCKIQGF